MKKILVLSVGAALVLLAAASARGEELVRHPVLEISEWTQNWENLSITVRNPGKSTEQGSIVVLFYEDGNLTGWKAPVELPAQCVMSLGLRLSDGGSIVGIPEVVIGEPHSITDAPDPVMREPLPIPHDEEPEEGFQPPPPPES